jgi:membrane-bound serine protease (ClpP class)
MRWSSVPPGHLWSRVFVVFGCVLLLLLANVLLVSPRAAAGAPGDVLVQQGLPGVLTFLVNPNVAFVLLMMSGIGLYLELSHPGAIAPGVVGAIALVLFLLATGFLPINWVGLLLVGIAFVFLSLDVRLPSHGVLTTGALLSLVLGALLAFNDTGVPNAPSLNPIVIAAMVLVIAAIAGTVLLGAIRSHRLPVTTGKEAMVGQIAMVTDSLAPTGRVKLHGEDWAARNVLAPTELIEAGQKVRVLAVNDLTLEVAPLSPPDLRHIAKAEEYR